MLSYHACSKCDARVRRSRIRNILEFAISPLVLPWRCSVCDRREYKFRFIDMNPPANREEDDEVEEAEEEVVKPVKAPKTAKAAKKKVKTKAVEVEPEEDSEESETEDASKAES
jgi:hypothetical protein